MAKMRCAFLLVLCNMFFIYYSLLKGANKGRQWQLLFLGGAVVQIVVEILLFETMECLWINFFVPSLVAEEVQRVNTLLVDTVDSICVDAQRQQHTEKYGAKEETRLQLLNAADYLFVSAKMAKAYPRLVESMIVQSYQSHLPGEIAKKWLLGANARITRYNRSLRQASLLSSLVLALQSIATAPFLLQRVLLRFTQPLFLTSLIMLWSVIYQSVLYMTLFVAGVAMVAAFLAYRYLVESSSHRRGSMRHKIVPITTFNDTAKAAATTTSIVDLSGDTSDGGDDSDDDEVDVESKADDNTEDFDLSISADSIDSDSTDTNTHIV